MNIYKLLSKFLGTPPKHNEPFNWSYMDKNKKYQCYPNITPISFYQNLVKPFYSVDDHISIIHDPRNQDTRYFKTYTIEFLGSVVEERPIKHLNLPIQRLKELVKSSLDNNQPVWFGCDVGKYFIRSLSLLDMSALDDNILLNLPEDINMTKADRLVWGQSLMTHAMLFTGYNLGDDFEVENSWGITGAIDGYLKMTSEWFDDYVFQIVINKKFLSDEEVDYYQQEPYKLPLWDPYGSLAK